MVTLCTNRKICIPVIKNMFCCFSIHLINLLFVIISWILMAGMAPEETLVIIILSNQTFLGFLSFVGGGINELPANGLYAAILI